MRDEVEDQGADEGAGVGEWSGDAVANFEEEDSAPVEPAPVLEAEVLKIQASEKSWKELKDHLTQRRPWKLLGPDGTKKGRQWVDRTQPALLLGPCDNLLGGYWVEAQGTAKDPDELVLFPCTTIFSNKGTA